MPLRATADRLGRRARPSQPAPSARASAPPLLPTAATTTMRHRGSAGLRGGGQTGEGSSTASPRSAPGTARAREIKCSFRAAREAMIARALCHGAARRHGQVLAALEPSVTRAPAAVARASQGSGQHRAAPKLPRGTTPPRCQGAGRPTARYPRGMAASNRWVYSSRGAARICSVLACSTTMPSFITSTSSLMKRTTARSWLMNT